MFLKDYNTWGSRPQSVWKESFNRPLDRYKYGTLSKDKFSQAVKTGHADGLDSRTQRLEIPIKTKEEEYFYSKSLGMFATIHLKNRCLKRRSFIFRTRRDGLAEDVRERALGNEDLGTKTGLRGRDGVVFYH
ncbi:hypothetical protein FEM48_Zijuj10G0104200 [Ziziphus jujuba var. spinosa]|uniref:Uncharacterized protein n=1 Tax=Ziziphus jujuba var. spinosa TaxID=714518 RepID=A0A978UMU4_ZIZJJ|nr:hypothetical protein FEM48_Zijuj10G0104200 [Ziziphus jujuba var. spinosa]